MRGGFEQEPRPTAAEAAASEMVELTRTSDETSASILVARLAEEGIPAVITGQNAARLFSGVFGLPSVVVRRGDLARAQEFLQASAPPPGWEDQAEAASNDEETES